jgi:ribosomal protein S18 acetylase RimI-like enzyme
MPRPRITIRRATERDAAAIARIFTDAFGPSSPKDVRKGMRLRDCRQEYLVAVVDGVPVSILIIQYRELLVDGVPMRTGGIAGVATHWAYRGRGLATALMRDAIRRIRARGISNTTLFTGRHLPAIRIYSRLGYTETEDWRVFYDVRQPGAWIGARFGYRTRWLPRTSFGKDFLRAWSERILIATPRWRATVAFDGRTFRVSPGRRGRPDIVMRGRSEDILECFGNRLVYDRNVRSGKVTVVGDPAKVSRWRRIVTLEWRE